MMALPKRKLADVVSAKVKKKPCAFTTASTLGDDSPRLYCLCQQPKDNSKKMVQCSLCVEWYHLTCVNLDEDSLDLIDDYMCKACIDVMVVNPNMSKEGLLRLQGRVTPKEGWGENVFLTDLSDGIAESHSKTKREKQEGFMLFREEKILGIQSNRKGNVIFIRATCDADRRPKTYNMFACFNIAKEPNQLKWIACSCPAGNDGDCKHSIALLYQLIDIVRIKAETLPLRGTCTSRLQMWHVKKPKTDEPFLLSDLEIVKHDPAKPRKALLGCAVRTFNVLPPGSQPISKEKLENFVKLFDKMDISMPVIGTIKSNECIPVQPKIHQNTFLIDKLWEWVAKTPTRERNENFLNISDNEIKVLKSIQVDLAGSKYTEVKTRLQSRSHYWHKQRSHRLTASMFGTFVKMRDETDPVKTFQQKRNFVTAKSLDHGLKYEPAAFSLFTQNIKTQSHTSVGLIVNPQFCFLGASPDRLVLIEDQLYLVEIKCPYAIFKNKETIRTKAASGNFYLFVDEETEELELKKNSDVYHQIQGQLLVCNMPVCFLVVFVPPGDIEILMIMKNNNFTNGSLLPKLSTKYYMHLLPSFAKEMFEKPTE